MATARARPTVSVRVPWSLRAQDSQERRALTLRFAFGSERWGRYFGRVPVEAGLDHEVDGIAVLDRVLLEELGVRQGLALEQEALRVRGGRAWGSRELRLDLCHGVGGLDGERVGLDGLRGLERHADGFCGRA